MIAFCLYLLFVVAIILEIPINHKNYTEEVSGNWQKESIIWRELVKGCCNNLAQLEDSFVLQFLSSVLLEMTS
jgi:hypothetical protein